MKNKTQTWERYFNSGNAFANGGDNEKALEQLQEASKICPDHALTWNNIGVAKMCLGYFKESIEYFNKAIELDYKYKDAYHNRGLAHSDLGDLTSSLKDLSKAIELDNCY